MHVVENGVFEIFLPLLVHIRDLVAGYQFLAVLDRGVDWRLRHQVP